MRVILRENIENLGKKGDIVDVAAGFGRNFLIPKKLALKVTPSNRKMIEIEQQSLKKKLEKEVSSYREIADQLNQTTLTFSRKTGEKNIIFGSVSSSDIKEALEKLGFIVEKKKILLDEPIKEIGSYSVSIKIFHEEQTTVKVEVVEEGKDKEKEEKKKVEPAEKKEERTPEKKVIKEEQKKEKKKAVSKEKKKVDSKGKVKPKHK